MCDQGFFAKQLYDDIGILSVKLQQILIYLIIVNILHFIFIPSALIICMINSILLYCGLRGAYERSESLLKIYFWMNISLFVIVIIIAGVSIATSNSSFNFPDNTVTIFAIITSLFIQMMKILSIVFAGRMVRMLRIHRDFEAEQLAKIEAMNV